MLATAGVTNGEGVASRLRRAQGPTVDHRTTRQRRPACPWAFACAGYFAEYRHRLLVILMQR